MFKKSLLIMLFVALMAPWAVAQEPLTINDGSSYNPNIPMYGGYFDDFTKSEWITPASSLEAMDGGTISKITFYVYSISSYGGSNWDNTEQIIFMREISNTTYDNSYYGYNTNDVVFQGTLPLPTGTGAYEITLNTPYTYNGGNLLIGIYNIDDGNYKTVNFYGVTGTGDYTAAYGYNGTSIGDVNFNRSKFMPKTTFTYETSGDCPKPKTLAVADIDSQSAVFSWSAGSGYTGNYDVAISETEASAPQSSEIVTGNDGQSATSYSFTSLTPQTTYWAYVRAHCGSDWAKTSFTTDAMCDAPTGLSATNQSSNTADLSWTAGGTETSWNLRYKKTTDTDWTTINNVTLTNGVYTLGGLSSHKTYIFQVQANCPGDGNYTSDWSASSSQFTTQCGAVDLTYSYGFEDAAELDCWTMTDCYSGSGTNTTGRYSGNIHGGSYSFQFYNNYNATTASMPQSLITPQLNTTNKGVRVEFYYRAQYNGSSYEQKFKVGYSTTNNDVSSFTWDDEISTTSTTYTLYQHDFAVSGIKYIAIQYTYSKGYSLFIDDITLSEAPSCIEPSALAASGITSSTATLSWMAGSGSQDHWDIYYSTSAMAPTASTTPTVSNTATKPYTIGSLTESTTYYAWVRGNCGDNDYSEWSEGISFTTACNAFAIPHDYGFEDAAELDCWTIRNGYSSTGITSGTTHGGTYKFQFSYGGGYGTQYLITPELSGTSNGLHVQFYYRRQYTTNTINVGHSTTTNETTAFTWNETTTPTQSYSLFEYDFPANTKYIAIKFNGSAYDNVYIDDISFTVPNNCAKPTDLTAVDNTLSSNGITLTWTAGGEESEWTLQYATNNTFTTGLVTIEDINTNQKAITGLTANTTYYARVKANCSATSESEWCNDIYDFTTSCGAYDIPHSYGFEAAAEMDCWTVIKGSSSYTGRVSGDGHNSSSYCFEFYYTSTAQYLISPEWSNATNGVHVEFYYKRYNSYANSFRVGYTTVANTTNDADFTWTDAITNSASTSEYQKFEDDFVANNIKHIAIKYETTSYSGLYVDDIAVSELPSCIKPKNLAVDNSSITAHTATLSWTAGHEETAWTLQYSTNADFSGTPTEVEVVTNPTKQITGLAGSTTYYARVKAECGENNDSDWSNVISFTTDVACIAPTGLNASARTAHTANVYWTAADGQSEWEIAYSTSYSFDPDATEGVTHVTGITGNHSSDNPYILSNIPGAGSYYLRVRSNCGGIDGNSAWSDRYSFSISYTGYNAPSNFAFSNITTESADFTWTGASTNDYHVDYEFCYSTTNSVPELVEDENYFTGIENASYALSGLTENTTYYAWVRDNCGTDGYSSWTASGSFSTLELCPTPSNLHMTAYTATTATLAWNAVSGQDAWLLYYSTSDVAPDDETTSGDNIIAVSTTASYTIESLTAETTYYAWVRGNCTASDYGYSSWSSVCEFMPSAAMTLDLYTTGTATNNDRIPFYANNTDSYAGIESQFIIPATDMGGDIPGGTIQKLTFYSSYSYDASFGAATFEVKISEVDETYFASNTLYTITSDAVYSGGFSYSNGKLTITLATPYVYKGGNLLVDIKLTKKGSAAYINWDGVTSTNNQSIYKPYSGTNTRYKFSPKTTITYIPATAFTTAGNWNVAGNWSTGVIPASTDNVILKAAATIPAEYKAYADVVALGTGGSLTIANGGQLYCTNSVQATVKKAISHWTGDKAEKADSDGWYAISSPIDDIEISLFVPTAPYKWNVYRYDEPTAYWNEYRSDNTVEPHLDGFDKLELGRGYLYRSTLDGDIEFEGAVNAADITYPLSFAYDGIAQIKGFNLVGNPFTHEISLSDMTFVNAFDDGFYLLEETGDNKGKWSISTTKVAPMQAFLVQATGEDASIAIANNVPTVGKGINYANDNIMFMVKNAEYSDEAYVLFKKGHGLNKIDHRNAEIPMLYVINNGEEFAIADMPDNTSVINLGFEAKTMGQYTISLKAEGQYSYMHLYDKLTGEDIDMLVEDSYTFIGSQNDRKDRFVLNLNYNAAGIDSESDIFAYQNGSDIIVNGEGELQVIDITGRKVMTTTVNGVEIIRGLNSGVYIFRVIGETQRTQKIVVR